MRGPVMLLLAASAGILLAACSGDDEGPRATSQPSATPVPAETAQPEPTPSPATRPAREVTGLFLEPRPTEPDAFVSVPPRPPSPFAPWDRESVVVYDLETMTETNYGPGRRPSISPDETRLVFNLPGRVRVVDLATGETVEEFEYTGGLVRFVDDNHLYMPGGPGQPETHDLRTGERTRLDEIGDPGLKARIEQAAHGQPYIIHGQYQLRRLLYDETGEVACRGVPKEEYELCSAEFFERWVLEDVNSGRTMLAFRAYSAEQAGPGELVVSTSPQCEAADGSTRWCPEVLAELRADDPEGESPYEEAHGTTNIFIVDIETGEAEFIATASFTPDTRVTPESWPLIANRENVVWTQSYCSLDAPGNTRIYERETGRLTELDVSLWVEFTQTGDLGVDPFGPRAILDTETLEWNVVLPDEVTDVGESSSGRYLYVGGVLGHGGLCG